MKDFEANIDTALKKDMDIMYKRAGESVDLDIFFNFLLLVRLAICCYRILLKLSSDWVSMTTFSKRNELIEVGKDKGSIHEAHYAWKYMYWIGYFPLLD
jgi:hypothetical protein